MPFPRPLTPAFRTSKVVVLMLLNVGILPAGNDIQLLLEPANITPFGAVVYALPKVNVKTMALVVGDVPPVNVISPSMSLPATVTVEPVPAPAPTTIEAGASP